MRILRLVTLIAAGVSIALNIGVAIVMRPMLIKQGEQAERVRWLRALTSGGVLALPDGVEVEILAHCQGRPI